MKFIRKMWSYFFPSDSDEIPIPCLAFTVSALSCGCFVLWLWIVHTPISLKAAGAAHVTCLSRCQRTCSPTAG
jgi:hypothetical protein